jgi:hypothetical protein
MQQQPPHIFIQHQQRLPHSSHQSLHPAKREELPQVVLHQRQQRKEEHQLCQREEDQQLDDDEDEWVESKALRLVSRLQEPLEFSAHLEAEIRARACRAPPILLAAANRQRIQPLQNDQRRPSLDQQQHQLDPPQLIIYPAAVAALQQQNAPDDSPQQISNNGDDGVSLHFSSAAAIGGQQHSSPAASGNSVVLLSEERHADHTATTFRLFYQFSPTKQQQQQGTFL